MGSFNLDLQVVQFQIRGFQPYQTICIAYLYYLHQGFQVLFLSFSRHFTLLVHVLQLQKLATFFYKLSDASLYTRCQARGYE